MQLRDAEALGVLDQHHGRVGDVDPDLDHRRGDQHVGLARGKASHRLLLLARPHAAVQQDEIESRKLAPAQALQLSRGGAHGFPRGAGPRARVGVGILLLLDQRAHDVCLPARPQLLAQQLIGLRAAALAGDHPRAYAQAAGGQLVQLARVEISVPGQGERARDRRRGHVQRVRRALGVQRHALAHAETMLLVDYRQRQVAKVHVWLDQRVRADDQRQLAAR